MPDIRENLSAYIEKKGIKQVRIAEMSGLTDVQLGAILGLKRKLEANEFIAICDALEVSPSEIRYFSNAS